MELLWIWLYGLKTPISVLCGVGILFTFIGFLSARSSGRGEASIVTTSYISLGLALFWAIVYAIPSPSYNKEIVYRDRVVVKPVVKRYIAQKQVLTRTITVKDTQDARFNYCVDQYDGSKSISIMNQCMEFSKEYMQPRVVVQRVNIPVYSGVRTIIAPYTRDARVRWCYDKISDVDKCTAFAFKMEAGPQIQVRYVHDSYQDIFDKCNSTGTIPSSDANGTAIRNDRIKTCGELALRASHDH
jgi:hypothetical protein